jgi:hypothetical protein
MSMTREGTCSGKTHMLFTTLKQIESLSNGVVTSPAQRVESSTLSHLPKFKANVTEGRILKKAKENNMSAASLSENCEISNMYVVYIESQNQRNRLGHRIKTITDNHRHSARDPRELQGI